MMPEIAWLVRQILMFAAYFYLHLILIFAMTALLFPRDAHLRTRTRREQTEGRCTGYVYVHVYEGGIECPR